MSVALAKFIAMLSSYAGVVPSILGVSRIKSPLRTHRLLAIVVWVGLFIAVGARFVVGFFQIPNLFLLHLYTIINFILLTLIFKDVIHPLLFKILIIGFPLFALVKSTFIDQFNTMNELNRSLSSLILMFYALSFFAKTLREMNINSLERSPLFWVSIGVLFYNAASFFIFIFSRNIVATSELWVTYFGIHGIFTILLYLFYTIALWVHPKT